MAAGKQQLNDGRLGDFLGAVAPSGLGSALVVLWSLGLMMKQRNAGTVTARTSELETLTGLQYGEICTALKAIRQDGHRVVWQGRDQVIVTLQGDKRVDLFAPFMCNDVEDDTMKAVLDYLNARTGKQHTLGKRTASMLRARMREGMTVADLRHVIDVKVEQWLGNEMEAYLRPSTLFSTKATEYAQERLKETIDKDNEVSREDLGRMWAG